MKLSDIADTITSSPLFVFLIVMFVAVILWQMDAMVSFQDAIYSGITSAFGFFPVIAIVGALSYLKGK